MKQLFFGLLVVALHLCSLERIFALHRSQKVFRKGWATDIIHFLLNRFLTDVGFRYRRSRNPLSAFCCQCEFQAAVAAQPRLLQFLKRS